MPRRSPTSNSARASLGDRLVAWLPLMPRDAAAKMPTDGTRVSAVFAADGRHLYVYGDQSSVADDGTATGGSLPLRLIDVERGELVAEVAGEGICGIKPSADGRSLYAFASGPGEAGGDEGAPMVLRPAVPNGTDTRPV